MGNCLGMKILDRALKRFNFFGRKNVAAIQNGDAEEENRYCQVSLDSSNDGVGIVDNSQSKMVEKELRFSGSSVITDANEEVGAVEKMMEVMQLEQESYDLSNNREGKMNGLYLEIEENYEELSERFQLLRSQKKMEQIKKDVVKECFVPLTEDEKAVVARALSSSNRKKILVSHENSNIDITGEKLQCLRPRGWLNDEVINLYLELLKEREKREPQKFLKCHFFNTFFYKKLISGGGGYNFQSVRRWTTPRKLGYSLLECDKIFVPIHKENHWCLAIINKKEKKFQYLDSLTGVDTQVLNVLAKYYVDEVKDKNGIDVNVSSWDKEFVTRLPRQENMFDCGMFMIKYIDFYSRDIGLCFNQENMRYFRQRTAKEILELRAE